jgi:prepilin-type N-terminal cleavage/methylation domain-containing protein
MLILKKTAYKFIVSIRGFTMVEIIVALAILSTSVLAVFAVFRMCASTNVNNQRLMQSVLLTEKLLCDVAIKNNITYQTTKGAKDIYSWQIQTAPAEMDNLVAICIKVQWFDQHKPQEYELCSLLYLPAVMEGR